jgi:hypothetical protein
MFVMQLFASGVRYGGMYRRDVSHRDSPLVEAVYAALRARYPNWMLGSKEKNSFRDGPYRGVYELAGADQ